MRPVDDHPEIDSPPPARRRGRRWRRWGALGILAACAACPWPARVTATDGGRAAPTAAPGADDGLADCHLMIFARQALEQDEELGALNVGVTVRGRVATLWGGIPSAELARRVEERLRRVAGIRQVRNELRIEAAGEPQKNLFARPAAPPAGFGSLAPGSLTSRSPVRPAEYQPGAAAGTAEAPPREAVSVTPPLVLTFRPPPVNDLPPRAAPVPADLARALDRLRGGEERFRQVRVDLRGGVVYLGGVTPRPEDMMEFANRVSRVPGVERVILPNAGTPRQGTLQLP